MAALSRRTRWGIVPSRIGLFRIGLFRIGSVQHGFPSREMCRHFVDQQFCHYAFFASLYRATCNGFCFAQGRRAGRPRRGNAAT